MKRFFYAFAVLGAMLFGACEQLDSELYDRLDSLEGRVAALETQVSTINSNIAALQSLLDALGAELTISSVTSTDGGFTIKFSDGKSFVITNGKDGVDGKSAPVIGIKQDADGIWYWTLDGDWLTQGGAKVAAQGKDGIDGQTPLLKVEDGWWMLSYDGADWTKLIEADPAASAPSIKVTEDEDYVYFTQGDGSVVKVAKVGEFAFALSVNEILVTSADPIEVGYTLAKGDETVKISVTESAGGYTAAFADGVITITPPAEPVDGFLTFVAVKNSTGEIKMQSLVFNTYVAPEKATLTWDFGSEEWQAQLAAVDAANTDHTNWDLTYNGLTFYSAAKSKYNTTYIQCGGKGSTSDRVFKFVAPQKGVLKVWVSNTGGSEALDRFCTVKVDDGEEQSIVGGVPSTDGPKECKFEIPAGQVYIYPTGNALRFYKIEFTYMTDGSDLPAETATITWDFTASYVADINVSDTQVYLYKDGAAEVATTFAPLQLYLSPNSKAIKSNNKACSADGITYHPLSYGGGAAYIFFRTDKSGKLKVTATIGKDPANASDCKLGIKKDGVLEEATLVDLAAYDLSVEGCAAKTFEWDIVSTGAEQEIQIVKPSGSNSPWIFSVEFTYTL